MGLPTVEEEKNILFQGMGAHGELRNSSFIIRPTEERKLGIFEIFDNIPRSGESGCIESDLFEMTSTFVDSSLYTIGGRVPNDFELSDSIRWLDIQNSPKQWEIGKLPFPCADPVIGVYKYYLFILPGVWKYGYYDEDEDAYLTNRKGYIWDTKEKKLKTEIDPPKVEGENWQWRRIRACTALDEDEDEGGLLIAMDGEKNNFFLYKPEKNEWKICDFRDPLPKFIGETSFAASNGRLYILEVGDESPAFLYIYDIKEGKLVMDKMPIQKFDGLWSMCEWDRVVRIVPVADDKLCFLWLGPISYENEKMWPPYRILHYLKVKFFINPNPSNSEVEVEAAKSFNTKITNLLDCLPCDPEQFRAEVGGRTPLYVHLISGDPLSRKESEACCKPEEMGDPSVEVTEEKPDAPQSECLKAVVAISEGKLDEAMDYLTEAIILNPISAILYETRASVFVKLNNPNAAIRDANAAFEINPASAKGYKIRGMANAMLSRWEAAADDLHIASNLDDDEEIRSVLEKVELNIQKIEEHRMRYERTVKPIKISFSIYNMRRQKSEQDSEALSAFNDGQVIGIHSTSELETRLSAAKKTSRLAILYFTAKWCEPSVIMSPLYTSLAAKYPGVVFLKVDVDEAKHVDDYFDISAFPTFLFIRNGKVVDEVEGAGKGALERKTARYAIQSFLDKM